MDKKKLWALVYELTGDPWTETEEEVEMSKRAFYRDLESGDVQVYIDSLEENKGYDCRPIDGIHGEYDFKRMDLYDKVIDEIRTYQKGRQT